MFSLKTQHLYTSQHTLSTFKMLSTRIFGFFAAFAAAVSAAPVVGDSDVLTRLSAANITEEADRDLRNGEMLVYGLDGRSKFSSAFLATSNANSH